MAQSPLEKQPFVSTHAEAQKLPGGYAAFIDAEHALDIHYAKRLGVKTDELLISQPDTGEQALEITEILVRSGAMDVVVIDSVAALVPKAEIEGEMGDSHMGLQARLMSQALRKLTAAISRSNTSVIFTNQMRQKIGVMFGNPENDNRRKRSQILRLFETGYTPHRPNQGRRKHHRVQDPCKSCKEQNGAAV